MVLTKITVAKIVLGIKFATLQKLLIVHCKMSKKVISWLYFILNNVLHLPTYVFFTSIWLLNICKYQYLLNLWNGKRFVWETKQLVQLQPCQKFIYVSDNFSLVCVTLSCPANKHFISVGICCCPSVCNVRAPYSDGSNFRQYFYGIRYPGHPLTFTENFMEIIQGEPLRWGS